MISTKRLKICRIVKYKGRSQKRFYAWNAATVWWQGNVLHARKRKKNSYIDWSWRNMGARRKKICETMVIKGKKEGVKANLPAPHSWRQQPRAKCRAHFFATEGLQARWEKTRPSEKRQAWQGKGACFLFLIKTIFPNDILWTFQKFAHARRSPHIKKISFSVVNL